uniref:DNA/RNA-binding protein Alba-like domain-containing protein n=1 Tax=Rhodosorus marinus TaxID=101924 RepID=A0A7S3EAY3_9RHOD|mmetsp:Transcript_19097/g.76572  ORF Transcript_19097/g.76572 Transcript_19097/m.76572 type:complete len:214 (+) Transcript_19097:46-687(+)
MEKYRRVEKDEEAGESPANQIRVTATGRIRAYVSYATKILEDETNEDGVVLLGLGNAIGKALTVSELLRRNVSGLHQVTELGSVEIKDRWEPLEEGLDPIETVRNVSSISVHLSKKQLNENAAGYQPPIERESEEQVQLLIEAMDAPYKRPSAGGPRGRGRRGSRKPSGRPRRDDKPGENAYNVNVGDTVEEDANGNGDEESDTKVGSRPAQG